jgi:hypothetical protein
MRSAVSRPSRFTSVATATLSIESQNDDRAPADVGQLAAPQLAAGHRSKMARAYRK